MGLPNRSTRQPCASPKHARTVGVAAAACLLLASVVTGTVTDAACQTVWTKYEHNPVLDVGPRGAWDDRFVSHFSILYDEGIYKIWYTGNWNHTRFGYATSPDGLAWMKHPANPILDLGPKGSWDEKTILLPNVLHDGIQYKMWYNGGDGYHTRVGYAASSDGVVWTKYEGNPVMDVGAPGEWDSYAVDASAVLFEDSVYHMWYYGSDDHVRPLPFRNETRIRIGYASSPDGINWTKHPDPVLDVGPEGSWDDEMVLTPTVQHVGETYHMWYGGGNRLRYRIAYATSPDGITWTKHDDPATTNPEHAGSDPVLDVEPPDSWEQYGVYQPRVMLDGTTYRMWYQGFDATGFRIGYATSTAGQNPVTGVSENRRHRPRHFSLEQNYPNPFNPSTSIGYRLAEHAHVTLKVFNLAGQVVATLVDGKQGAGEYRTHWNPAGQPSGMYVYRLQAGGFVEAKKMLLVR